MASPEHLEILKGGTSGWNSWRASNPDIRPDLCSADLEALLLTHADLRDADLDRAQLNRTDLRRADLTGASLRNAVVARAYLNDAKLIDADLGGAVLVEAQMNAADLTGCRLQAEISGASMVGCRFTGAIVQGANIRDTNLFRSDLTEVDLSRSNLSGSNLRQAKLRGASLAKASLVSATLARADLQDADLRDADLREANLTGALLEGANLAGASLEGANMVGAQVDGACFDAARVYGVSAWDLKGRPRSSRDLVVTPRDVPAVTADDIRVAQFMYLLINNPEIRDVLDTVTRKVVLLLGRFRPERKAVLDAIRDALRSCNLVPVLFDFDQPADRDITETVTLLARMARFVIADLTDPASIPQELQAIAPHVAVPLRLIVAEGHKPYSMSKDLRKYPWVIRPFRYQNLEHLLTNLRTEVIDVAESKRLEIERTRADDEW